MAGDLPTVVVAMSGGVDSSVTAALLVERGYRVIGMMLRLWNEPGKETENRCCTPESMALARRMAAQLGIPFYALDVQERFHDLVVQSFITGYSQGDTPNPCVVCNRQIRWGFLMERARAFGADFMATGHYARLRKANNGSFELLRGLDSSKDQSYVLSVLGQEELSHSLFPVGEYSKSQVRELAVKYSLPAASRPDSQDLCFLGKGDYRDFMARQAPLAARPGPIVNTRGEVLGFHQGLLNYTIGQRKGLGIASSVPLYVVGKDIALNTLLVGPSEALGTQVLFANEVNWVAGSAPGPSFLAQVKIRYKAIEAWGRVELLGDDTKVRVSFETPLRDITPGQRAVFYQDEICLGGGTIRSG